MSTDFGFKASDAKGYCFVSYNTQDSQRVADICKVLHKKGLPVWYDEGIPQDSYWETVITEKIENSEEVILFVTKGIFKKSISESYTYREYEIARIFEKKILVVFLDHIEAKTDIHRSLISWWLQINPRVRQGIVAIDDTADETASKILKALDFNGKKEYSINDDIKYPTFNSVIDNPERGDEREFIFIRKGGDKEWKREIELEPGKQYEVIVYFRNDADPKYNSSNYDHISVAWQCRMSIDVPYYISRSGMDLTARIIYESSQADNNERIDVVHLLPKDKGGKGVTAHYVIGQSKIFNKWEANGSVLPSRLFSYAGTYIGCNKLNGVIPAGDDYAGYVHFYIDVD